ncbi:unnamed protein product [Moneuplotes crassus]|uniref:Uncharacterized protein n=2 Tax=Euplotes crassus TaxID=5936 RepID=A0AAD1XKP2_EUPCR|nr:unnamed protein product [Moneuplotes crassus]
MLTSKSAKLLYKSQVLSQLARRSFAITIPNKKLHFIDHPVHGMVYPVVCYHKDSIKPRRKIFTLASLSTANMLVAYSLFVDPLLQYTAAAALCQPQFFIPAILMNMIYMGEYKNMIHAKRDMCINMWLTPQGKHVLVDTFSGKTRKIDIKNFYKFEHKKTRFRLGNRIDMYHGANNYLFLAGNPHTIDHEILDSVMNKDYIDTKNVTFDIDTNKSFTWEIDKLMRSDIRRYHKRITYKYLNPLTEEEKKNNEKKLKAIYRLRKNLKNFTPSRGLNHNFYRTMKAYTTTKKWADFNITKLQGSMIDFTTKKEGIETFKEYPAHPDEQKEIDRKVALEQAFLQKRKTLLRRPREIVNA